MARLAPRHREAEIVPGLQNVAGIAERQIGAAEHVPAQRRIFLRKSPGRGGEQRRKGAQCHALQHGILSLKTNFLRPGQRLIAMPPRD